jgi:Aspartyl protease
MRNLQLCLVLLVLFLAPISIAAQVSSSTTVPIQYRGCFPVVEVMINGQGPFLFSIDTGSAPKADIDTALVAKLKLPVNGKVRGGDPSGRNAREFDTVAVDSIKLGDVEFRNVTALSRDQRTGPNAPQVDGVLGFPLFEDYLLTLDYPGQRVVLARGEIAPANGSDILAFDNPRRIPVVEISLADLKLRAHIDSGNHVDGFILPAELIEKLKLASEPVTVGRARSVNNEIEIKQVQLSDTIKLGSFEFPKPVIAFPALSETNIGFKILREFTLTFDQKNKRVKLARSKVVSDSTAPGAIAFVPKEYVGKYGQREISVEGPDLFLQREGGPKMKMAPLAKDEFTLERIPAAHLKFVRDAGGRVTEMQILNQAGRWEADKKATP